MLAREVRIGNYNAVLPPEARQTMILLMEEISEIKGYRELTLHLSVNIADMYLAQLAKNGQLLPKIVTLGTVSILLAAKLNEPCSPNFTNMVYLINARNPGELVL